MNRRKILRLSLLPAALLVALAAERGARSADVAAKAPPGMVWIPDGEFYMGSRDPKAREDERPVHRVKMSGFWMDATTVTNAQFEKFVASTGYITLAELPPDWEELRKQLPAGTPKPPDDVLVPGSAVFHPTPGVVNLTDWSQWWSWKPGADWT